MASSMASSMASCVLLSFNTRQLLHHASESNCLATARALVSLKPDIICLQEVFEIRSKEILARELRAQYPHQFVLSNASSSSSTSTHSWLSRQGGQLEKVKHMLSPKCGGLMIASRIPLLVRSFRPFSQSFLFDAFASKGCMAVTCHVFDDCRLDLFHTHLQADYLPVKAYPDVRQHQLKEVASLVRSHSRRPLRVLRSHAAHAADVRHRHSSNQFAVLVGDLNMGPQTLEEAFSVGGALDRWSPLHRLHPVSQMSETDDVKHTATTIDGECLDYIIPMSVRGSLSGAPIFSSSLRHVEMNCSETRVHSEIGLSDHFPISRTLTFSVKS